MPNLSSKNVANPEKSSKRPPIVVVMGHIDHGKSSLLDYIRKSNICAGEAGGITQHMGAYQAEHISSDGKKHSITFLDTPGHEAFCSIRTRGAQAADIAILVVSAEDGVKPQTLDALKAIKEQRIPYIVAINKIDKPNANVDKTKTSLGENEIYVEGWGGDIPCVPISALKGDGISELLDMIILMSELADLGTCPEKTASGVVVESEMDKRTGVSATLLIKDGALKVGDYVVAGSSLAPVRYIEDFKGKKIESATASMPVYIVGWNEILCCGIPFQAFKNKKEAEKVAEDYAQVLRTNRLKKMSTTTIATAPSNTISDESSVVILPIVIKTDTDGSLEGVKYELEKIKHDKVKIKIVSEGIGEIGENDVKIAIGDPKVLLIGFNVMPDNKATAIIERSAVPLNVASFKIIYELSQFVKEKLTALIPKEYIEEMTGRAKILALFSKEKDKQVVGGKVETGILNSGNDVRIMRRNEEIGRGKIRELQSKKLRVSEVAEGFEFGTMIEAKIEIAVGDRIEAVRTVEK
jgi:translation initiation factor IF-2